jgi:DNA polymerase IV
VLCGFTPLVEMASIDEAYLDMTGTERLYGPPLRAAHLLHERMKAATSLNCSIGIAASRLVAKICSDQAKPNGVLWVLPGRRPRFWRRSMCARPRRGQGDRTESALARNSQGGRPGETGRSLPGTALRQMGLALAGKAQGLDAGGWFDTEIGAEEGPKSISHEHTFSEDTADLAQIEPTLARLSEMVGRRLREHGLSARTIQLKLRYSDFSTITRAHSVARATALDTELFDEIRALFHRNWKTWRGRAAAGRARLRLVARAGTNGSAGRPAPRALATSASRRGPHAGPLR